VRRFFAAAVLCLAAISCGRPTVGPVLPGTGLRVPDRVRVRFADRGGTVIRDVRLEDYVLATALSEFAPAAGDPSTVEKMFEVQAIIGRTYAVAHVGRHQREGFDLCATTHCQLFDPARLQSSRWSAAVSEAVRQTEGIVLAFDGRPAQALFHADCGGHTSAAADVWGGDARAYLVSRADGGPARAAHATWTYRASGDAVAKALNADTRTRVRGRPVGLKVVDRDAAGRAARVAIQSDAPATPVRASEDGAGSASIVRGEVVRQVLAAAFGARAIRSTWFDVRRDGASFVFSGRGFGHGVGLCQAGALARITSGATPAEVIRFYYPGVTLRKQR
jgi:stage II sporulation protein D